MWFGLDISGGCVINFISIYPYCNTFPGSVSLKTYCYGISNFDLSGYSALAKATFTSKLSGTRLVVAIPRVSFNRERGDISRRNKLEVPASDKVRSGFVI